MAPGHQVRGQRAGLLPRRARWPGGREGQHRRATRLTCCPISRRRSPCRSRGATRRPPRSRKCSPRSADDDFGVKNVQLFSVDGGAEKTIDLFGGSKTLQEVTASHTLYLEEMGLKPGDSSYYAKATDNDGIAGGKTTTSDIYFVQIRPFRTDFKPAPSMAGGGEAAAPASRSASSRSSSGRSSPRRSTWCATAPRWATTVPREQRVPHAAAGEAAASRSRSSPRR